ncbi:hypothetical protein BC834DRAFT_214318 [Gloeopeniophorella convolvens]|nr:hypothetical protein BC834DRAFT_214318 [Gloeopeniophorella convolvens]
MSLARAFRGSALGTAKTLPQGHSNAHVRLFGLPRSATPADITRLLAKHNVQGVSKVALDYYRFDPTGRAFLTLASAHDLPRVLAALREVKLFSHTLRPATTPVPVAPPARARGAKGRGEAAERALVAGSGSQGGITDVGRAVLLAGLPGRISPDSVRVYLRQYRLLGGEAEVVKLERRGKSSLTTRVLVRLATPSEAHRLVRDVHMTKYEPEIWEDKYTIRAHVIH